MKKLIFFLLFLLANFSLQAQNGRMQRQEQRIALQYQQRQMLDSMVQSDQFTFTPAAFFYSPTGLLTALDSNTVYSVKIFPDSVYIYLPVMVERLAYRNDYTIKLSAGGVKYTTTLTPRGWNIRFSVEGSSPRQGSYNFTFDIPYSGQIELGLFNPWLNAITYQGGIAPN